MAKDRWFDISMVGDKQLEVAFNTLPMVLEKKIARRAVRATANSMRPKLARAAPVRTGKLRAAMEGALIRAASSKRNMIRDGIMMPTREKLGIPQDTMTRKYAYYPYVLEYGSHSRGIVPRMWIRGTTDREAPSEHARMRRIIQQGVAIEFNRRTWHGRM